jgi:PH (Pleckstrin Homology) domain-containing protein
MTTTSLQFHLDRGERELWAGVPRQGLLLRPSDVGDIPLSVLIAGFAFFWERTALLGGNWLFAFYGIPFIAVAVYGVIGRFWGDAWQRARTTYAVTNDRIIINSGLFRSTSRSLTLRMLSDVSLDERKDGSGTITFGPGRWGLGALTTARRRGGRVYPAFEMIPDARRVYVLIKEAQRVEQARSWLSDMTTTSTQSSLERGERQLWGGVPRQGVILRPTDALEIPFSLFWAGMFVVLGLATGIADGAPVYLVLLGILFFTIAFFIAIGRFFVDAWRRARTTYAVTSERIIIRHGLYKPTSTSIDLRTLSEVKLREGKDGTGTINFRTIPPLVPTTRPFSPRYPVFESVSDVWRVYAVIRDAQRVAPSPLRRDQGEVARA